MAKLASKSKSKPKTEPNAKSKAKPGPGPERAPKGVRKGPPIHARERPVGAKAQGNDGCTWTIIETRAGVKRWSREAQTPPRSKGTMGGPSGGPSGGPRGGPRGGPGGNTKGVKDANDLASVRATDIGPGAKTYLTHDNGGRAFMVRFDKTQFAIWRPDKTSIRELSDASPPPKRLGDRLVDLFDFSGKKFRREYLREDVKYRKCFVRCVMKPTRYKRVFVGKSTESQIAATVGPHLDGNTVLFEVDAGRYIFVSESVESFECTPGDTIKELKSPVAGSDVPYPWAIGERNLYLFSSGMTIDRVQYEKLAEDMPKIIQFPYDFNEFKHVPTRSQKQRNELFRKYAVTHKIPRLRTLLKREI